MSIDVVRIVAAIFGNPLRLTIADPSDKYTPKDGDTSYSVTVGTTDDSLKHYVEVYDSDGKLLGASSYLTVKSNGIMMGDVDISPNKFESGRDYYFRSYVFVNGDQVSHTITVKIP